MTLVGDLPAHVEVAAVAQSLQLADAGATFLGRGWGWNDYQGMGSDRSLANDDVDTVNPIYMFGPSPNLPAAGPWTFEAVVRLATPDDTGTDRSVFGAQGGGPAIIALSWRFGTFRLVYAGVVLAASVAPPSLAADPQEYYVAWTVEPNPAAPPDLLSTLRVWNLTTGEYAEGSATHAAAATPTVMHFGASNAGGGSPFTGDVGATPA